MELQECDKPPYSHGYSHEEQFSDVHEQHQHDPEGGGVGEKELNSLAATLRSLSGLGLPDDGYDDHGEIDDPSSSSHQQQEINESSAQQQRPFVPPAKKPPPPPPAATSY